MILLTVCFPESWNWTSCLVLASNWFKAFPLIAHKDQKLFSQLLFGVFSSLEVGEIHTCDRFPGDDHFTSLLYPSLKFYHILWYCLNFTRYHFKLVKALNFKKNLDLPRPLTCDLWPIDHLKAKTQICFVLNFAPSSVEIVKSLSVHGFKVYSLLSSTPSPWVVAPHPSLPPPPFIHSRAALLWRDRAIVLSVLRSLHNRLSRCGKPAALSCNSNGDKTTMMMIMIIIEVDVMVLGWMEIKMENVWPAKPDDYMIYDD